MTLEITVRCRWVPGARFQGSDLVILHTKERILSTQEKGDRIDAPVWKIHIVYTSFSGCFKHAGASSPDSTLFTANKLELSQRQPSPCCSLIIKGKPGLCRGCPVLLLPSPGRGECVCAGCPAPPGRGRWDPPLLPAPGFPLSFPRATW